MFDDKVRFWANILLFADMFLLSLIQEIIIKEKLKITATLSSVVKICCFSIFFVTLHRIISQSVLQNQTKKCDNFLIDLSPMTPLSHLP